MTTSAADLVRDHLSGRGLIHEHGVSAGIARSMRAEGIQGLLYSLQPDPSAPTELRASAFAHAALEERHRSVLAQVCEAFERAGIPPLILKGSATAYSLYDEPWTRYRSDTDFLVRENARGYATQALLELGYTPIPTGYDAIARQATFVRSNAPSDPALDLHWRISNSEVLSRVFSCDEVLADARPIPRLNQHALQPAPAVLLLLTCMHLAVHRSVPYYVDGEAHTSDRLIWLLDVQLLARSFSDADWHTFLAIAMMKTLCRVAADALRRSEEAFSSLEAVIPEDVSLALSAAREGPVWEYLRASRGRQMWLDFRFLPSTKERIRWARGVLFPPPAYMSGKSGATNANALAGAYAARIARGLKRLLADSGRH